MGLLDTLRTRVSQAATATGLWRPMTFVKVVAGTRDPANLTSGTQPTSTSYSCRGIVQAYETRDVDGEVIEMRDRRIVIIGTSLPTTVLPSAGDRVIAEGVTYDVIDVSRDAAAATYDLHARG